MSRILGRRPLKNASDNLWYISEIVSIGQYKIEPMIGCGTRDTCIVQYFNYLIENEVVESSISVMDTNDNIRCELNEDKIANKQLVFLNTAVVFVSDDYEKSRLVNYLKASSIIF